MSTFRHQKILELLRNEVALILQRDFRVPGVFITVIGTEISPDGQYANIHFSVLPEKDRKATRETLERQIYFIQQAINKKLRMRPVPKIRFVLDTSAEEVSRIDELLKNADLRGQENSIKVSAHALPQESASNQRKPVSLDKGKKVSKTVRLTKEKSRNAKSKPKSGRIRKTA